MPQMAQQRLVCAVTLVIGALVLAWSLSIEPADSLFYPATALLAEVWFGGAFLAAAMGWIVLRTHRGASAPGSRSAR